MLRLLVVLVLLFVSGAVANTSLDDTFCPFSEGTCTDAPIAGLETTGPPYSGANANPYIAEGVNSGSVGRTCNFNPEGTVLPEMPQLYKDFWLLAASQDLYNGRHLGLSTWATECDVNQLTYTDGNTGTNMCGAACGVCFLISGPKGSGVFMVNEIADYDHVGQNGIGLNFHLDHRHNFDIRLWGGASKDIYFKPVPCPVTGGMHVHTYGNYGTFNNAIYLVILNHRSGIKTIHTRGGPGGNQTWVPLARDWTNRWHYESNTGCSTCAPWQAGYGSIDRGSTDGDFELMITSVYDKSVICKGLQPQAAGNTQACVDASSAPLQFDCGGGVSLSGCGFNTTIMNSNYYTGIGSLTNCGKSAPPCATKPAQTTSSDASVFAMPSWFSVSQDPLGFFQN